MATYSLSFIVCNFNHSAEYLPPVPQAIGLYTPEKGLDVEDLEFPLWIAHNVIKLLTDYLTVPYPLRKLDLVIVPDLSSDAVATWGLSAFRLGLVCHHLGFIN